MFNTLGQGATQYDLDRHIQDTLWEMVECQGCGYTQCHCGTVDPSEIDPNEDGDD